MQAAAARSGGDSRSLSLLGRKEGTTVLGKHSPLQPLGRRGAATDQSYNLLLLLAVTTLILPENVSSALG